MIASVIGIMNNGDGSVETRLIVLSISSND
jgi:hypothetical protein